MLTDEEIREWTDWVIELEWHHAIWESLVEIGSPARSEMAINDHRDFFDATAQAHLGATLVGLYAFFDRSKGARSFPQLATKLKKVHPNTAAKLQTEITKNKVLLKKIEDLRSGVFAHRSAGIRPYKLFKSVGLTMPEVRLALELVRSMTIELYVGVGTGHTEKELRQIFEQRREYAKSDLAAIVAAIDNWREAGKTKLMAAAIQP